MASKKYEIGRFDYVEPVNLDLDKSDTEIVNNPEDYNISVNLEVIVPSRFFEEEPTYINASSDNGTVSFFGGVDTGNNNLQAVSGQTGFLSTSWTDISVNTTDKGNKDCIGIESINISYSPTFFPVITIKFVDVRGASLFMPQEKAYEIYTKSDDMGKKEFQSSSFFKSLFSIPSPIFKLTVKGFYGQAISYKLMMSKCDFDFDSQNGNFVANVQFAGYMYGIYTELPMSYIALAPYIDNKAYWNEKKFTFDNGKQIPTIPDFIVNIVQATKNAEQESSQSVEGKDLNRTDRVIDILKRLKNEFPLNISVFKNLGEETYVNRETFDVEKYVNFDKEGNLIDEFSDISENNGKSIGSEKEFKKISYYHIESDKNFTSGIKNNNLDVVPISNNKDLFFIKNSSSVEKYKKIIEELKYLDENLALKYEQDFNELLIDVGYNNNTFLENGTYIQCSMPVYFYVEYKNNSFHFYGVDTINLEGKDNKYTKVVGNDTTSKNVLTHLVYFNNAYINNVEGKLVRIESNQVSDLFKKITGSELSNSNVPMCVWKITTNILKYVDEDIKLLEAQKNELIKTVYLIKSEKAGKLLGFDLTIENVYKLIFAHIDTFMYHYYNVLKETNIDSDRTRVISNNKNSVCDVPDKILSEGRIPPYPTFVKNENDKKVLVWPYEILNQDIPETRFVERIINAATETGNDMGEAMRKIEDIKRNNLKANTKSLIPSNATDLLERGDNPYSEVYDYFVKNGESGTVDRIWKVFALRCYYFMYMYKKYRYGDKNTIDAACRYFAVCEAVNIKKIFGEKIDDTFFTELTSDKAVNKFFEIVKSEDIYCGVKENNILGYKYLEKEEGIKYATYPIGNRKNILLREDGEIIDDSEVNSDAFKIIDNPYFFEQYVSLIKSDEDFKNIAHDYDESFVNNMYKYYLGGRIISDNMPDNDSANIVSPYNVQVLFTSIVGNKSIKYEEAQKLNLSDISLRSRNKNYTSYINNYECVDTINVIAGGTKNNKNHFIEDITNSSVLESFNFLNTESATDIDVAYYFLWSLPIDEEYSRIASNSNFKRIPEVVLLREGAQYYWEDNFEEMKSNLNEGFGVKLTKDSVPIIKHQGYLKTLWVTNKSNDDYYDWSLFIDTKRHLSTNRRTNLKKYFLDWVNNEFSSVLRERFNKLDVDSDDCKKNGLPNTLMSSIIDLYFKEVIIADYSIPIEREVRGIETNIESFYKNSYKILQEYLKTIYGENNVVYSAMNNLMGSSSSDDVKLSVYLTLQTIYNKFVAGNKINRWTLGDKDSDFNSFLYLDTYYKEIGKLLHLNGKNIVDSFEGITPDVTALIKDKDGSSRNSVYNFMSDMCAKNGVNLVAMPINPYVFATQESSKYGKPVAWDLFDTIPYTQMNTRDTSCFISLYTYRPSLHLDIQDDNHLYAYENDGFDINVNGEKDLPVQLQSFGNRNNINEIRVPSFAVTYAKQNQSIFKNINISTSNFQTTDTAIQMTLNIASKGDEPPRQSVIYGQDIYSVYSNYAYMCEVEMMGCAPISPMMYFQLNNIPMFKGAYLIYSVEHSIVAGNMTTKFKGSRVNKHAIPFAKADVIYMDEYGNYELPSYTDGSGGNQDFTSYTESYEYNSTEDEKVKIGKAFDAAFNCADDKVSMCARYVYRIAYAYKKGSLPCTLVPGANANDNTFYKKLESLGYKEQCRVSFESAHECKKFINEQNWYYGDIVCYIADFISDKDGKVYSKDSVSKDIDVPNSVLYGHTQIYIGDARINSTGQYGWASSLKNNYSSYFVYSDEAKVKKNGKYEVVGKHCNWRIVVFRANKNEN